VRVTTAFNRVLAVPGASVASVSFTEDGIVIGLRRRFRLLTCPCGHRSAARYDSSVRRWRHLDLGSCLVWLEAEIRRVNCRGCGRVRTEVLPWARPGARHTRDVEDLVAWLAQRMDKTSITRLLRMSWEAVDRIVRRVVADHLDDTRLDDLFRIGVDEISYKRGHRYLTVVADHDTGRVVWLAAGRSRDTFEAFFDELGGRAGRLQAVSMDASPTYLPVTAERAPHARICLDPFHIIKWANAALDLVYRAHPMPRDITGRRWRTIRHALRAGKENLRAEHRAIVNALRRGRYQLGRAWELKELLRNLYRTVAPEHARKYLKTWCTKAMRSNIAAFQTLAKRLTNHFDAVVASVELGLSNSRLEGINSKIRVIQRRGYGHPSPDSLTAMIHLCLGGITITPPTQR
jgi:transposase